MSCGRHAALLAALLATTPVWLAHPASAWIPEPERAWRAVAQANGAAGRARVLALDVALLGTNGEVAATGTAQLDPDGHDRLELTLADGGAELHERTASAYQVTRNGAPVDKPLRLLPPFALLQAATSLALSDALRTAGVDPARVDLGMEGEHDCWVLGGRDPGAFDANTRPSLWVDQDSQQPVRIDDASGTQYRLGPSTAREGIRFPSWIEVRAAGWPSWRIEVRRAAAVP